MDNCHSEFVKLSFSVKLFDKLHIRFGDFFLLLSLVFNSPAESQFDEINVESMQNQFNIVYMLKAHFLLFSHWFFFYDFQVINRRKSSNPYITQGILKFRLLQILLNALALLIIAGKFKNYGHLSNEQLNCRLQHLHCQSVNWKTAH